jgi:hypothetical protein
MFYYLIVIYITTHQVLPRALEKPLLENILITTYVAIHLLEIKVDYYSLYEVY